jgi:signal transduction histidine kinase
MVADWFTSVAGRELTTNYIMHRILIIEDEPVIRKQMAQNLRFEGFETLEAENGRLGAATAISSPPDLIICDIMMPDLDGFGVLQALRDNPRTAMIPFIFLTALVESHDLRHGMDEGADDYLTKPYQPAALLGSVRRRLEKRNRQLQENLFRAEQVVLENITQCTQADDALRWKTGFLEAQANTLIDGILVTDQQGRILLQNQALSDLFEPPLPIAEDKNHAKQVVWTSVRTKNPEEFVARVVYFYAHPSEIGRDEIELINGTALESCTSPVIHADGTYYGRLWTFRDISERKSVQAERENLERKMAEHKENEERACRALVHEQELSGIKDRFVSMVSHEFRSPLSIISMSSELLDGCLDELSGAERSEQLKEIQSAVKRMTQMLSDFLVHGNCASGKMECKRARVEVEALCRRLISEVLRDGGSHRAIEGTFDPAVREAFLDEKIVRHILGNLLSNAVKYSSDGQPVKLGVKRITGSPQANGGPDLSAETHLEFKVTDAGIGIPAADMAKLGQTFHRAANVGTRPGTGMGLAIVKQFVELHRGTIRFESQEGQGTTVWVELPTASPALSAKN